MKSVNICMEYAWHDKRDCTISVITYFIEEPLGFLIFKSVEYLAVIM